jgi:Fe-S-cluster-containing dehydrogenase component/DMSO reductase anchor subunit
MNFDGSNGSATALEPRLSTWSFEPDGGLIGSFLDDQGDLSAVERFTQFHADVDRPLQGRYYSALMPARAPGPGEQLAFEVDLDRCSGCKACVAACHTLNGLDEGESWRDVGLLIGHTNELPVIQHVTSACHHCLDPACLSACPVDAYEKDPLTGIVRHLDDQCFGCRYCSLACPYDVPKFHAGKGIVRKCDMCWDRLGVGEAPACVQACPHEAIRILVVDKAEVSARAETGTFLPAAPSPGYTLPATCYRSTHVSAPGDALPADDYHIEPEEPHWPLVVMLVLLQLSVGGFAAALFAVMAGSTGEILQSSYLLWCVSAGWAGMVASLFHLGRPLHAYRALIGIRHSWLSREVLAFGLFTALATLYVELALFSPDWIGAASGVRAILLALVVATGSAGVACSVMVYHVVQRPYWRAAFGGFKFFGTAIVLGQSAALAALGLASLRQPDVLRGLSVAWPLAAVALGLVAATSGKLWLEARLVRSFSGSDVSALRKTAALLGGPLQRPARLRRVLGVVGGVALPALAALGAIAGSPYITASAAVLALAASVAGEMAERYLFFTAVVRPKMPGGLMP